MAIRDMEGTLRAGSCFLLNLAAARRSWRSCSAAVHRKCELDHRGSGAGPAAGRQGAGGTQQVALGGLARQVPPNPTRERWPGPIATTCQAGWASFTFSWLVDDAPAQSTSAASAAAYRSVRGIVATGPASTSASPTARVSCCEKGVRVPFSVTKHCLRTSESVAIRLMHLQRAWHRHRRWPRYPRKKGHLTNEIPPVD